MKKIKNKIVEIKKWFETKNKNKMLKKENKDLQNKIIELQNEIMRLEDLTDNDLNIQRVKDLRSSIAHEREIKRSLRLEIKELREQIKDLKSK